MMPVAALPPDHYTDFTTNDAQCWNDVLCLSGGALEDTKMQLPFSIIHSLQWYSCPPWQNV